VNSEQRHIEHQMTWLDWYEQGNGNPWTDEVLPLLFACGSMAGLVFGLIRLLTSP
jgi:hypothetical protein